MQSIPAALHSLAPSISLEASTPRGGRISTNATNFPDGQLLAELALVAHGNVGQSLGLGLRFFDRHGSRAMPRLQAAGFAADFLDVLGRGAAAAADNFHAGQHEPPRVLGHIFGRAQVQIPPLDGDRQSCVRHGAERLARIGGHLFDGLERHARPGGAIQPHDVHRPFVQRAREIFGGRAVPQPPIILDTDLGDHRNVVARRFARREYRFAQLVQIAECFKNQQIDAGFRQRRDLFAEQIPRLGEADRPQRLEPGSQRPHRSGDKGLIPGCFPRDAHPGLIDGCELLGKAKCSQSLTVSTESVSFNNLGPGFDEFLVHVPHQCGQRQVQLVVAAIEKNTFGVERRAHGSIGDQDAILQRLAELGGSGLSSGDSHVSFYNSAKWDKL